jgi:two-component system nitrate/nitrite response regulator NarL
VEADITRPTAPWRVAILSDVRVYCEALAEVFMKQGFDVSPMPCVSESAPLPLGRADADIVVIDTRMTGGLSVTRRLRNALPLAKLIVVGLADKERDVIPYIEAGINGYVSPEAGATELVRVVSGTVRGESPCSPRITAALMARLATLATDHSISDARLTGREMEVLELVEEGLSNKEIATRLHIAVQTAKNHVHNILSKLNLRHRAEASSWLRHHSDWTPESGRYAPS